MLVYQVPQGTFTHENEEEPLKYEATLADGSPLPAWMSFNEATQTFSGEVPPGEPAVHEVIVTAIDSAQQKAQVQLKIAIK